MLNYRVLSFLAVFALVACGLPVQAQISARMLRYPDVSDTQVAFVYAGDIWLVAREGGIAHRLSSPAGEESFPRFSPDGQSVAFSGNYDGNMDVYVLPVTGGEPRRITHHPMPDRVLDWYPDGNHILYASSMESGRQRFNQFFRTPAAGGLPEKLPVAYGEFGVLSADGKTLAFTTMTQDFRTWKRYRGGWSPDIWLFDLEKQTAENITNNDANDSQPMWHERTLFFLSDRGPEQRNNLWAYDLDTRTSEQVTHFDAFDLHFPSAGPSDIVFEAGGKLYLLDLNTRQQREVQVDIVTDLASRKPRTENAADLIQNASISPTGKRAVFEARGDVFSVPAEHGPVLNLTASSGVAERYPTWSPDGKQVAYFSDRSGEYELTVRPADGTGEETTLTRLGPGFRFTPLWSPDSKKIVFVDQAMQIHLFDLTSKRDAVIDRQQWMYYGGLSAFRASWSPDSRWLAYARDLENRSTAIVLYDARNGESHQATSGYYTDASPAFDPEGNYLFFLSGRTFSPSYSDLDNSWIYPNTVNIVAAPLRKDVASPMAPRNDVETADTTSTEKPEAKKEAAEEPRPVEIDLEGFEERLVVLPPKAGNYADLRAVEGKVLYRRLPRTGAGEEKAPVVFYDLKEREEKTILEDADMAQASHDGKMLLVRVDDRYGILEIKPDQKLEKPMQTGELEMTVDPLAEWRQLFSDAWRFERDLFYDPNMHGVDWNTLREQYGALINDAATRWDVSYVLGEMIAELNASHTYQGGGDTPSEEKRNVGLLGIDWRLENGAYRVAKIISGAPWDSEVRSPLAQPGINVGVGDYILAVNGRHLNPEKDPWAAFDGLAGQPVVLTVNSRPTMEGARQVVVNTLSDETRLRHLAWIEANRKRVDEATEGRVGYIYVPSTGVDGQTELVRQFQAQFTRPALIVDERFNSGGQIPDRFIELLNRPALAFWAVRDGREWQWPPVSHFGPKVMLINGWSGSGGDAFPFYFREAGLGPLIGTRTWGGLIGLTGAPPLIDGGAVTVPTFRMYGPDGKWFPEGYGVEPDILVVDDPGEMAKGRDPQLERAIEEALRLLEAQPAPRPERPAYEDRSVSAGAIGESTMKTER